MLLSYEQIAEMAHENNRAYCHALGDYSQAPWRMVAKEIRASAIDGVEFHINNPDSSPEQSHNNWLKFKQQDGWKHGIVKDPIKKEHPCFCAYSELPVEQRVKDFLFAAIVDTLKTF
jgi:hypothetical protein